MRRTLQKYHSTLIVVEGASEEAFVKFLISCRGQRGDFKTFNCKDANGGDPKSILRYAVNVIGSFDERYVVFDTDVLNGDQIALDQILKSAKKSKVKVILMNPNFDSVVLDALNINRDVQVKAKIQLSKVLNGAITQKETYQKYFSSNLLDDVIHSNTSLAELCELFNLN